MKTRNGPCEISAFASEMKVLTNMRKDLNSIRKKQKIDHFRNLTENPYGDFGPAKNFEEYYIQQFRPGNYSYYEYSHKVSSCWECNIKNRSYHSTGFHSILNDKVIDISPITKNIQYYLKNAVYKRCSTTERPIACLLSGGLDSSLIAALVSEYHKEHNLPPLETYSIGLLGSEDLKYARLVAEHLGSAHNEIVLNEDDFLNAIPEVIQSIESFDTTSVRASIGNWLLGKYISKNSQAKVIFNGDGSDELCGGYLYINKAPDNIEFDRECRRLLKDIHAFDVLRSDKCISSHGLEPRTPFLDREWTQYYLSIPISLRNHSSIGKCEKFLLRNAFSSDNYGAKLLPDEVLWRRKEAFSDGVSKQTRSLYEIIKEFTDKKFVEDDYRNFNETTDEEDVVECVSRLNEQMFGVQEHLMPKTTEQYYYRKIFEKHYSGMGKVVPYFWMPKYVNAKDASARTLDIYSTEP
jgi:asparagine synthase (glutamine-hydrolysing)